jgi:tetratricopeptide (TPR) repeat protein
VDAMFKRALQGQELTLGSKHTLTLDTFQNLGILYYSQGKLAEAETMYTQALQGYEEAIGPAAVSSYIPALSAMMKLGLLHSTKKEKNKARTMYEKALSGFVTAHGPSSARCRQLQRRLAALDLSPPQPGIQETISKISDNGKARPSVRKLLGKLRK